MLGICEGIGIRVHPICQWKAMHWKNIDGICSGKHFPSTVIPTSENCQLESTPPDRNSSGGFLFHSHTYLLICSLCLGSSLFARLHANSYSEKFSLNYKRLNIFPSQKTNTTMPQPNKVQEYKKKGTCICYCECEVILEVCGEICGKCRYEC